MTKINTQTFPGVLLIAAGKIKTVVSWVEKWFYVHIVGFRLPDYDLLILDGPIIYNHHLSQSIHYRKRGKDRIVLKEINFKILI